MTRMEQLLRKTSPALVLVEGDTNGVLGTALATAKLGIPLGHVEARVEKQKILEGMRETLKHPKELPTASYGDGKASEKIAAIIKKEMS